MPRPVLLWWKLIRHVRMEMRRPAKGEVGLSRCWWNNHEENIDTIKNLPTVDENLQTHLYRTVPWARKARG